MRASPQTPPPSPQGLWKGDPQPLLFDRQAQFIREPAQGLIKSLTLRDDLAYNLLPKIGKGYEAWLPSIPLFEAMGAGRDQGDAGLGHEPHIPATSTNPFAGPGPLKWLATWTSGGTEPRSSGNAASTKKIETKIFFPGGERFERKGSPASWPLATVSCPRRCRPTATPRAPVVRQPAGTGAETLATNPKAPTHKPHGRLPGPTARTRTCTWSPRRSTATPWPSRTGAQLPGPEERRRRPPPSRIYSAARAGKKTI